MPNTDNLCMSCMKPIGDEKQCPYCGYHVDSPQLSPYLPIKSVVANRYLVGKVLDFNGDGVTYAGWDLTERVAVKVREFLPDAICSRENGETQIRVMQGCERAYTDCYQSFLELWRKLMRLMGLSTLISVTDVVEDNGTAYAIYEYTDAVPLRKYLLSTSTGYIPWERARQMFGAGHSALGGNNPPRTLAADDTRDPRRKTQDIGLQYLAGTHGARRSESGAIPRLRRHRAVRLRGSAGRMDGYLCIRGGSLPRTYRHRPDNRHHPRD